MSKEVFDRAGVQAVMGNIESSFNKLANNLADADERVITALSSADEAMYGQAATKIRAIWDENSSTLQDFKKVFETWSSMVVAIGAKYGSFEEGTFKVEGVDGIEASARDNRTTALKTALGAAAFASVNADAVEGVDINGVAITETKTLENGKIINKIEYSDLGYYKMQVYDEEKQEYVWKYFKTSDDSEITNDEFLSEYNSKYNVEVAEKWISDNLEQLKNGSAGALKSYENLPEDVRSVVDEKMGEYVSESIEDMKDGTQHVYDEEGTLKEIDYGNGFKEIYDKDGKVSYEGPNGSVYGSLSDFDNARNGKALKEPITEVDAQDEESYTKPEQSFEDTTQSESVAAIEDGTLGEIELNVSPDNSLTAKWNGHEYTITKDADGNLVIHDTNGYEVKNDMLETKVLAEAEAGNIPIEYDNDGNIDNGDVKRILKEDGSVLEIKTSDNGSRVETLTNKDNSKTVTNYDENENITEILEKESSGESTLTMYDENGNETVVQSYDSSGNLVSKEYADGYTIKYEDGENASYIGPDGVTFSSEDNFNIARSGEAGIVEENVIKIYDAENDQIIETTKNDENNSYKECVYTQKTGELLNEKEYIGNRLTSETTWNGNTRTTIQYENDDSNIIYTYKDDNLEKVEYSNGCVENWFNDGTVEYIDSQENIFSNEAAFKAVVEAGDNYKTISNKEEYISMLSNAEPGDVFVVKPGNGIEYDLVDSHWYSTFDDRADYLLSDGTTSVVFVTNEDGTFTVPGIDNWHFKTESLLAERSLHNSFEQFDPNKGYDKKF